MNTIILKNTGPDLYCIAEVEQGKKYRIIGEPDKNITFSYVITDDQHSDILFCGSRISKYGTLLSFSHIVTAEKTGHLCIKNGATSLDHWTEMPVTVEEVYE